MATWAGLVFLAVVLDVFSRRIVGWAMADPLRTERVLDALNMAATQRRPEAGVHPCDQGTQYTSLACSECIVKSLVSSDVSNEGIHERCRGCRRRRSSATEERRRRGCARGIMLRMKDSGAPRGGQDLPSQAELERALKAGREVGLFRPTATYP